MKGILPYYVQTGAGICGYSYLLGYLRFSPTIASKAHRSKPTSSERAAAPLNPMTTGLWPALLAALWGGLHDGSGSGRGSIGGLTFSHGDGKVMIASFTGAQAFYWWMGIICFIALSTSRLSKQEQIPLFLRQAGAQAQRDGLICTRYPCLLAVCSRTTQ